MNQKIPTRLVLFDIDGTILLGGPLWKDCFIGALNHYFPDFDFPRISFNGKTDVQICREMMSASGLSEAEVEVNMHIVIEEYIRRAGTAIDQRAHEIKLLPGIVELIENLSKQPDIFLGLLTGNVKKGAIAKLKSVGLDHFFKFGVYGDDHYDRYQLPALAQKRVKEDHGLEFSGKQIVIIGDTIHDVNCGKSIGVRSIAVGTGRNVDQDELRAQNPDYYFEDFSSVAAVIEAIIK